MTRAELTVWVACLEIGPWGAQASSLLWPASCRTARAPLVRATQVSVSLSAQRRSRMLRRAGWKPALPKVRGSAKAYLLTFLAALSLILASTARGQQPTLTHLYPVAGQQGTTVGVAAAGKFTPWPPQVWVDAPGITFKPAAKAPTFEVEIGKDAAPGPHLVRFFNEKGASAPRVFVVSQRPELREAEPNDRFAAPQQIEALPATIGGRLDKNEDVDSYAVKLRQGQTLVAWLEAYVLASTFDGLLRIVEPNGAQLAFNHDGRTLDPFLSWKAPADGTYIVQVMGFVYPATSSVGLTGGENAVYRLHLTAGPFVHHALPGAISRREPAAVKLVGWNLTTASAQLDATKLPTTALALDPPGSLSQAGLPVSDLPETVEAEPHAPLAVPSAVTGHLAKAGEDDRYTFTATKGKAYQLRINAAALGSPLDAWLKIENPAGKELARNDDAGASSDPQLVFTAPADGPFTVALGDVAHRGGPEFFYRLAVTEAAPAVEATIAANAFTLEPGKTVELKVAVKRLHGFKTPLQLIAKDLPEGVTAAPLDLPEKDGEATLKFTAIAEAAPANKPFQLSLLEKGGTVEHPVRHLLTTTSDNNGVPQGYTTLLIPEVRDLWLTVAKK